MSIDYYECKIYKKKVLADEKKENQHVMVTRRRKYRLIFTYNQIMLNILDQWLTMNLVMISTLEIKVRVEMLWENV